MILMKLRSVLNRWRRKMVRWLLFRTVFGEHSSGRYLKGTRISPSVCIEGGEHLVLGDDVFIGHFCFIEAGGGVQIGAGTQITNYVSIVTHSTHRSVRLGATGRGTADVRAPIAIGERCFIGPHSTVEAGATLGRGCVVASHSRVRGAFADFSMIAGSPARAVGDVRAGDARWLAAQPAEVRAAYEAWQGSAAGVQQAR